VDLGDSRAVSAMSARGYGRRVSTGCGRVYGHKLVGARPVVSDWGHHLGLCGFRYHERRCGHDPGGDRRRPSNPSAGVSHSPGAGAGAGAGQHYSAAYPKWADKPFNFADSSWATRFVNSLNNGKVLSSAKSTSHGDGIRRPEQQPSRRPIHGSGSG
jgi:hypothetical protein